MRVFKTLAALLSLSVAGVVLAAPASLKSVERFQGETTGKYIVKFKPGVSRRKWLNRLKAAPSAVEWDLINGIAGIGPFDASYFPEGLTIIVFFPF